MIIYYYTGNDLSNFFFEILPLIGELKKRGYTVIHLPDKINEIDENDIIFTNVPSEILFTQIKEMGKGRLFQITRSTDSAYNSRWINRDAYKICSSCEYEFDAIKSIVGEEKVVLTGMPYLDHYADANGWEHEEIFHMVDDKEKYILGLQISHQAHSSNRIEYSDDFVKDFYVNTPKKFPYPVAFKTHQNHNEGWPRPFVRWVEAHHSFSPKLLYFSEGIYVDHLSFMLLEAVTIDKPIYIHEPYESWMRVRGEHHQKGWWSDFDWWDLEKESFRKKVKSWFPPNGTNSKSIADLIESCI